MDRFVKFGCPVDRTNRTVSQIPVRSGLILLFIYGKVVEIFRLEDDSMDDGLIFRPCPFRRQAQGGTDL